MSASWLGMSKPYRIVVPLVLVAACLLPGAATGAAATEAAATEAAATEAAAPLSCQSADLRYPFEPGGPKTFGVFNLRIAGGRCALAHRVAKAWMTKFEAAFRAGRTVLPRSVNGFSFATLPAHVAQTFRERGRTRATTIWFDYRIPNG